MRIEQECSKRSDQHKKGIQGESIKKHIQMTMESNTFNRAEF